MRLLAHGLSHLVRPRDVPTSRFGICKNCSGSSRERRNMLELAELAVDCLALASNVDVGGNETTVELVSSTDDLVVLHGALASIFVVGRVDVGVLLEVDHGSEDVVPSNKAESPLSAKLRLCSPHHRCCPLVDVHMRCAGIGGMSAIPEYLCLGRIGNIGTACAVLEAKDKGDAEVHGLELINHDVACSHLDGWYCFLLLLVRGSIINEVAQGCDRDRIGILLVVAFAFGYDSSRALRSEGLTRELFCLQPVDWGCRLLGLELVLRIVNLMDHFEELGWHAILWKLLSLILHALVVEPSVAGMSDLLANMAL